MDDEDRLAELNAELDETMHRLWGFITPSWQISLGRIHIHRRVGSQSIAKLYVLLNVILVTVGALLILLSAGRGPDLGIALVVGALFSMGAFISAVWVLTVEDERTALQRTFGPDRQREIKELRKHRDRIWAEIESLDPSENDTEE